MDERIDPKNTLQGILSIHLKRYDFARAYCEGKNVLDAACGAGYGSFHLSKTAAWVTGVDIDHEAIQYAKKHYEAPNLEFGTADVAKTGFPTDFFDVICSFETIEHLNDHDLYLREVVRILKPDGTYIVSSPKASETTHNPRNPYHTIEFSQEDLKFILRRYFKKVDLYGQRRKESEAHYVITKILDFTRLRGRISQFHRLRHSIDQGLRTTPFENMNLDDIVISQEKTERATEIIAVCKGLLSQSEK
jgi:2-polyprenyl-3-methyl-5-hydroxy-6-metoxy-1,4-benzoquinol methylase